MKKLLAGLGAAALVLQTFGAARVIEENFSAAPLQNGWQKFGPMELMLWDAEAQNLKVTWDSNQGNNYFYLPLGITLTRSDDFSLEFDLRLDDVQQGTFQVAVGLFNQGAATKPGFFRGMYGAFPNLVEFDYFADYTSINATVSDMNGKLEFAYDATQALEPGKVYRVVFSHVAGQSLVSGNLYAGPTLLSSFPKAYPNAEFGDFQVDAFSVSSYSGENGWGDIVVAHGVVDNVRITLPPIVGNVSFVKTGQSHEVHYRSRPNIRYVLEKCSALGGWQDGPFQLGDGSEQSLVDLATGGTAFYRVRAEVLE